MNQLLARLWRLGKPLQWRFLWLVHAKFICGITGVIRTGDGQVLLLRHRLWPESRQWGFPTGYANKGERHEDTIAREVREETGLTVKAGRLLKVRSGYKYRIEVYYEATLIGGLDGLTLDPREILEARLFSLSDLPAGMPEAHRELADEPLNAGQVSGACRTVGGPCLTRQRLLPRAGIAAWPCPPWPSLVVLLHAACRSCAGSAHRW